MNPTVAIVARDQATRLALVRGLDAAPLDWVIELHRDPPPAADVVVCEPGTDVEGAIVFDGNPEDLVATISERLARPTRTIVVTSASGGTGATTVALHLAAEYTRRGHLTGVVDLSDHGGIRGRLGLPPAESDLPVPVGGGFRLLPSLSCRDGFDRVIVDAPAGSLAELPQVDAAVAICSPSPDGARRTLDLLDRTPGLAWTVVINRLGPGGELTHSRFARMMGREVVELGCCARLRDAEDEGRLHTSGWSRWSRAIGRLACELDAI